MKEDKSSVGKKIVVGVLLLFIVGFALYAICYVLRGRRQNLSDAVENAIVGSEGEVHTDINATIEEVIKTAKMYVAEYPYNGVVTINDDEGNAMCYVAYEGTVKAGIDNVEDIRFVTEDNEIKVYLPEIKIYPPDVYISPDDYIYEKEKYKKKMDISEIQKLANDDLSKKVMSDERFKNQVNEIARNTVKAMVEPWMDSSKGYKVSVYVYGEDDKNEKNE